MYGSRNWLFCTQAGGLWFFIFIQTADKWPPSRMHILRVLKMHLWSSKISKIFCHREECFPRLALPSFFAHFNWRAIGPPIKTCSEPERVPRFGNDFLSGIQNFLIRYSGIQGIFIQYAVFRDSGGCPQLWHHGCRAVPTFGEQEISERNCNDKSQSPLKVWTPGSGCTRLLTLYLSPTTVYLLWKIRRI